jgi:hypothetical protein
MINVLTIGYRTGRLKAQRTVALVAIAAVATEAHAGLNCGPPFPISGTAMNNLVTTIIVIRHSETYECNVEYVHV